MIAHISHTRCKSRLGGSSSSFSPFLRITVFISESADRIILAGSHGSLFVRGSSLSLGPCLISHLLVSPNRKIIISSANLSLSQLTVPLLTSPPPIRCPQRPPPSIPDPHQRSPPLDELINDILRESHLKQTSPPCFFLVKNNQWTIFVFSLFFFCKAIVAPLLRVPACLTQLSSLIPLFSLSDVVLHLPILQRELPLPPPRRDK